MLGEHPQIGKSPARCAAEAGAQMRNRLLLRDANLDQPVEENAASFL